MKRLNLNGLSQKQRRHVRDLANRCGYRIRYDTDDPSYYAIENTLNRQSD